MSVPSDQTSDEYFQFDGCELRGLLESIPISDDGKMATQVAKCIIYRLNKIRETIKNGVSLLNLLKKKENSFILVPDNDPGHRTLTFRWYIRIYLRKLKDLDPILYDAVLNLHEVLVRRVDGLQYITGGLPRRMFDDENWSDIQSSDDVRRDDSLGGYARKIYHFVEQYIRESNTARKRALLEVFQTEFVELLPLREDVLNMHVTSVPLYYTGNNITKGELSLKEYLLYVNMSDLLK